MTIHAFMESRPDNARCSLQTFLSAHHYESEAYSKWNRPFVHAAMLAFSGSVIVSYIDALEDSDPEALLIDAFEMIRLHAKRFESVRVRWTPACPISRGHTYSAFKTFNQPNFTLEV